MVVGTSLSTVLLLTVAVLAAFAKGKLYNVRGATIIPACIFSRNMVIIVTANL